MPRSGQTYKVITSDKKEILTVLQSIQDKNKKKYPYLESINPDILTATIVVEYKDGPDMIPGHVYIEFNLRKSRCYIIGTKDARDALIRKLNALFESEQVVIRTMKIPGQSIYHDMLEILVQIHNRNFIATLDARFGAAGFKSPLDKQRVLRIQYGFAQQVCASTHIPSKDYVKNALECTIKFGLWKVGKFLKNYDKEKHMSITVKTDYTFRFYYTYEVDEILSVMKKLDVDPDVYYEDQKS